MDAHTGGADKPWAADGEDKGRSHNERPHVQSRHSTGSLPMVARPLSFF